MIECKKCKYFHPGLGDRGYCWRDPPQMAVEVVQDNDGQFTVVNFYRPRVTEDEGCGQGKRSKI